MSKAKVPELTKFEWQKTVIQILSDPPSNPSKGNRYIIGYGPTGDWFNKPKQIAEWNGTEWEFTLYKEGMITYIARDDIYFQYLGNKWRPSPNLAKRKVSIQNSDYHLLLTDAGSVIKSDTTSNITYYLPENTEEDVGIEYCVSRLGSGIFTIACDSTSDVIEDSNIGGGIENNPADDNASASLSLRLIDVGHWIITSGSGTWTTF